MKRLLLAVLTISMMAAAVIAQTTTITGTVKDLTQTVVTSGKVTFTLKPSSDTTISGLARFSSSTVTCLINGSGLIKAQDGISTCTVTTNTSLQPTGTYYAVAMWPYNVKTSTFNFYAVNASYDLSTIVPTPTTSPADNFVDIFSTQTIGGNKTFSGADVFNGNLTLNGNNTFAGINTFNGASAFGNSVTVANPGVFTSGQMNLYVQSLVNNCNPGSEFQSIQGGGEYQTEAGTFCLLLPSSATVQFGTALQAYLNQQSSSVPGAAIQAFARCNGGLSSSCHAMGAIAVDGGSGFPSANYYDYEAFSIAHNTTSNPIGILVTGDFFAQPTAGNGIAILPPSSNHPGMVWPNALDIATASSNPVDASNCGLCLDPTSTNVNSPSQGIRWTSKDPVSGFNLGFASLDANGNLNFVTNKSGSRVTANGSGLPVNSFVTSTYTNATTTFSALPLSNAFNAVANTNYTLTCHLSWRGSAGTTGPKFQVVVPAGTTVAMNMTSAVTATTVAFAAAAGTGNQTVANTGTITTATEFPAIVTMGLEIGATPGTITFNAAANGAGTLTIDVGSYCVFE